MEGASLKPDHEHLELASQAFQLKRRAPPCLIVCETLRSRGFHLPETFTQAPQTPEQQEATHAPKLTLHSFFALASTSRASGLAPPDPDSPETIMSSDPTSDCTRTSQDTQTEGGGEEEDDNAGVEEDDDVVVELLASSRAGDGMGGYIVSFVESFQSHLPALSFALNAFLACTALPSFLAFLAFSASGDAPFGV